MIQDNVSDNVHEIEKICEKFSADVKANIKNKK